VELAEVEIFSRVEAAAAAMVEHTAGLE